MGKVGALGPCNKGSQDFPSGLWREAARMRRLYYQKVPIAGTNSRMKHKQTIGGAVPA